MAGPPVAGRAQALQILRQGQVVLVGGIWLRDGDDGNGTNETSDVVHVAVGIVPGDAAIHPQHLVDAEIVVEDALQILAAKPGLRCCTGLSRHSSVVIRVPRPFTSMLPPSRTTRWPRGNTGVQLGRWSSSAAFKEAGRQAASRVLRPGIEAPVGDGDGAFLRRGFGNKDGAGIAQPHAVGGPLVKVHASQLRAGSRQHAARALLGAASSSTRRCTSSTRERWRTMSQ
jgi:hypothetical protein